MGFKIREQYETGTDIELDASFVDHSGTSIIAENNICVGAISYGISDDGNAYVYCAFRDTPTRELITFTKEILTWKLTTKRGDRNTANRSSNIPIRFLCIRCRFQGRGKIFILVGV